MPFMNQPRIEARKSSEARRWGVRSVVVEFGVFGRPDFPSRGPNLKTLLKWVFEDLWTENWGARKTPNTTKTDLTPHLRPSEAHPKSRNIKKNAVFTRTFAFFPALRAQRLKKFKILTFSSEIEIFKRAAHQTPNLYGEF